MAPREIYKDKDGKRVPSVTTILNRFKDSGGLIYWANQQGLEGKTLDDARDVAATAGTLAHDMVECFLNNTEWKLMFEVRKETLQAAERAFATFRKWLDQTKIQIKHTEVSLVSEKHKVGGRLDAIGMHDGQLVLIDWKSSNSVYADYLLQMAGYRILWEENYPEQPIKGFHLCRFAKEKGDFSHHYYPELAMEGAAFLTMRSLYGEMKEIEKRVK